MGKKRGSNSRIKVAKASNFATEDVNISNMPDNVITHILDRLPLQDAVRTSILSRNWRFKWTMLSQLVFDGEFFFYLVDTNGQSKFGRIISRLLLNLKGAITKFVLYMDESCCSTLDDEDIIHWMLFLSRKGVKDLTIVTMNGEPLKLPVHLFSCLELKHLKLLYCRFDPPAGFHGFPNLLSFESGLLYFESSKFEDFITQCPLLEILNMRFRRKLLDSLDRDYQQQLPETGAIDIISVGKVKLVEIAKLANLKALSLSLCDIVMIKNFSSILELVGFFPKLQELNLDFVRCQFTEGGAKKRFLTTFPCLKTLSLSTIDLGNSIMLSYVFEMIRSFPNLQILEITASDYTDNDSPAVCSPNVDYTTMRLLKLQSVVFNYSKASENELCLFKCLLACSPFLKRIVVSSHSLVCLSEKFIFAQRLLKLHRASPVAEIDFH